MPSKKGHTHTQQVCIFEIEFVNVNVSEYECSSLEEHIVKSVQTSS